VKKKKRQSTLYGGNCDGRGVTSYHTQGRLRKEKGRKRFGGEGKKKLIVSKIRFEKVSLRERMEEVH